MKRTAFGITLCGGAVLAHALLEATGKAWLSGIPEPVVDFAFGAVMLIGVLMIVPAKVTNPQRWRP